MKAMWAASGSVDTRVLLGSVILSSFGTKSSERGISDIQERLERS